MICVEWHCNAHSNHLVIIAENSIDKDKPDHDCFVSFLDLDMSYTADSVINENTHEIGFSSEEFSIILWKEYLSLMECLIGSNDCNSGVPMIAKDTVNRSSNIINAVNLVYMIQ